MMLRALIGALAAGLVTGRSRLTGSLSAPGQAAAFALGVLAAAASWGFALTLVVYYVAADALTRWRAEEKKELTIAIVPQATERSATQVMANGAVFVLFAVYALKHPNPRWSYAALGALAAASADTWGTEIGTMWGGVPRSVVNGQAVARGMSGGITALGTLASVGGALLVALVGVVSGSLRAPRPWLAIAVVTAAGIAGAFADSVAGAMFQTKRWCDRCREWTERRVHPCGYRTSHRRGFYWLTNDLVNFVCTGAGAVAAVLLARLLLPRP